jgi:hypothetical protein
MKKWLVAALAGLGILSVASVAFAYVGNWFTRRSLRGPQMVCWLTATGIKEAFKAGNAIATLPLWSAASVKVTNGTSGLSARSKKIGSRTSGEWIDDFFRECDLADVSRCGHGYHYWPTVEAAQIEGAAAAEVALFYGLKVYSANAESEWLKGRKDHENKPWMPPEHLRATALAFVAAFRSVAPQTRLHLCAAWYGPYTFQALDAFTLAHFDGMERMIFGSEPGTRAKQWGSARQSAEAAQAIRSDFAFVPLWASGSVESKMTYAGVPQQVAQVEAEMPTSFLGVYFGNYAGSMWASGNKYSTAWSQIIPALQGGGTLV